jgi:nicotinamidase-related amidase
MSSERSDALTSPEEVVESVNKILDYNGGLHRNRGSFFLKRLGFGKRPAIVNIDLANIWTRSESPYACSDMERIIPAVERVLAAGRAKGIPIVFTTMAYAVPQGPNSDSGLLQYKWSTELFELGSDDVDIDDRLGVRPDEQVMVKKRASAFHGTYLAGFLRAANVDTIIVTGVTASGCVRNTCEDGIADGFRPIVVRECIGDRVPGVVEWNLFDIDAKFGDVESLDTVLHYLEGLEPGAESPRTPEPVSATA